MADPVRRSEALDAEEERMRQEAARLFGVERSQIDAVFRALAERTADPQDPIVREVIRRILLAYTSESGAYHRAWLERYAALINDSVQLGGRALLQQLPPATRQRLARAGVVPQAASVGLDFTLRNPRVLHAADDRATRLAALVTQGTAARVTAAVKQAYSDGVPVRELAQRIVDGALGEEISGSRATRIARTESIGAMVQGEYATAVSTGVFRTKEWLHSGNRRDPRDNHLAMDGEKVPLTSRFSNGLLHPHDPNGSASEVINCGCSVLYHDE
jgi:hypothetical protein